MIRAFLKLLAITALTSILTVLAVLSVRWMGLQQEFKAPPHPWFEQAQWKIAAPRAEEFCRGDNLDARLPANNWIVTVPILRKGEEWLIPCASPITLEKFLAGQTHTNWILNIQAHDTWSLDKLVDIVAPFEKDKRFAVITGSQKVAVFLRKKAPQWLFAADRTVLARFRVFESLWIEPAMEFWPDFVITSFNEKVDGFRLDERGAAELLRRHKRIIWNKSEGATPPTNILFQGIMTGRPSTGAD